MILSLGSMLCTHTKNNNDCFIIVNPACSHHSIEVQLYMLEGLN